MLSGCSSKKSQNSENPQTNSTSQPLPAQATQSAAAPDQGNPPPPPADEQNPQLQTRNQQPSPASEVVIPAGTRVEVRLDQDLGSKISESGQAFRATVALPVQVQGQVVIPRGARAEGVVSEAKPLGRFKGGAELAIRLDRIRVDGHSFHVATSTVAQVEQGKGKRSAGFIGGGAGFGAILGGIAGGGKGALIGGLAGAGAGSAGTALTGNKEIVLPAETRVTFRLEHPVRMTND